MSFLTSLFLVAFVIVGPCLSQESDSALFRLTLEAVAQKQDMILQRFDEQERKLETQQTMMQEVTRRLTGVERSLNNTQEELVSKYSREDQYYFTMTAHFNEFANLKRSTDKCLKTEIKGSNCKELLDKGVNRSGVYTITPEGFPGGVEVYCDQETADGGWTMIFQRKKQSHQLHFNKTYEEYASGFGDPNGEHWTGNRVLHSMTGEEPFTLRVDAKDLEGESRTAIYQTFSVGPEDTQFTLSVGDYSLNSTLGDSLRRAPGSDASANNMKFSTFDRDNDRSAGSCSESYGQRGGWWYNLCGGVNPTAPFGDRNHYYLVAFWRFWEGSGIQSPTSISEIQFLIRP